MTTKEKLVNRLEFEALIAAMRLAMEIEEEATERKINTVAHIPDLRNYEQGRADAALAFMREKYGPNWQEEMVK